MHDRNPPKSSAQPRGLDIRHLVISHCEDYPLAANGVSNVARHLVREQRLAGHDASLTYLCGKSCGATGEVADIPIRVMPLLGAKLLNRSLWLDGSILERLTESATERTIFHLHHGRDPILISMTNHFRKKNIPYAVTIHGRYSHILDADRQVVKPIPALYVRLIERLAMNDARFVHAVTPAERDIVNRLVPRARCRFVPNAAYSTRVDGVPELPTRQAPFGPFPKFGYCGRYAIQHKGLDLLVQGFAVYKRGGGKGTLELIGPGRDRDEIAALAKALGIEDDVTIGEARFGPEKIRTLQSWDFFVMSSRFDGLPMAGLEAALAGLPLIASVATGFQEYIEAFAGGFVLADTAPATIAKALHKAERTAPADWSRMSQASFKMALSIGDWTAVSKRLVDLYGLPETEIAERTTESSVSTSLRV